MGIREYLDISSYDKVKLNQKQKVIKTIIFFLCAYPLAMAIYLLTSYIAYKLNIQLYNIHGDNSNGYIRKNFCFVLFNVGLFAPVREELGFRLCLTSNKKIATAGIFFTILFAQYYLISLFPSLKYINKLLYFVPLAIIGSLWFYKYLFKRLLAYYRLRKNNFYRFVFLFDGICFGLLHIMNFRGEFEGMILAFFLMTSTYIVIGLIICYIRINFGFLKGLIFHMVWNAVTFTILSI